MKFTGIVRKVDELGRIVLPKELRSTLNINEKDPLEIYVDEDNKIVLKKYEPACIFCGGMDEIVNYKGYNVCHECLLKLQKAFDEQE
ncbi:MAG: SpoVT-AbrB domain-containing protein [Thermocaproicibacter melissae]|jgi:AbrB family transcriptional regulator, transcriptional pleiotropic regulator of transition state genes|uniref:AbrB/MazE/SpoVT family DNA-binding domain-containing protein n=1 Tax=Thermocaproicibacter melissae TaxID=2966552 RepID=UPI0024B19CF9|nr:AbrB/MazE/SpoVT family DNA-binding domain-containing protein [Thermocaproicibacter melissae]WBY63658.1 AbrB/MazE/SpoVT family DNA-binding domain-containing protein [Thermocaproicibacter melissae]